MTSLLTAAFALSTALPAAQAAELMAHYPVVETSGSTVAEVDGWAPDATLSLGARIHAGVDGQGVWFGNGAGDLHVPADDALEPAQGSVELWVAPSEVKNADLFYLTTDTLVHSGGAAHNRAVYALRMYEDGSLRGFVLNDDPAASNIWTSTRTASDAVVEETWTHVALSWCDGQLWIVVDGQLAAHTSFTPVPGLGLSYGGSTGLHVGRASHWGGTSFGDREYLGHMDELKVYEGCRTPTRIAAELR